MINTKKLIKALNMEEEQYCNEYFDNAFSYKIRKDVTEDGNECYRMDVSEHYTNDLIVSLYSKDRTENMEELIMQLIGAVYVQEINYRKRYCTYFKGTYITRKMQMLTNAYNSNNQKKIDKAVKDMVEKFSKINPYKQEISDYKDIVCRLYAVKDILCGRKSELEQLKKQIELMQNKLIIAEQRVQMM